jgi:hypothetical protein
MTKTTRSSQTLLHPVSGAKAKTRGAANVGVRESDVRLTVNIRGDLRVKLKVRAAMQRTTVGELIERWVESWK